MPDSASQRRLVFLSHTSELRTNPAGRSFIHAAEEAVTEAGHVIGDMARLPAGDHTSAAASVAAVEAADLYVLVAGFRYGSLVRDRSPAISYTELEFEAATAAGRERRVFLLGDDAELPPSAVRDLEHGVRQEAFRRRVGDAGLVTATVTSPDGLKAALGHALRHAMPTARRRIWNIPARSRGFTGRDDVLARLHGPPGATGPTSVQVVHDMAGVGKTTAAIEYAHQYAHTVDIAWWVPAENPDLVPDHLARLARSLELVDETTPTDIAVARLLGHLGDPASGHWLLVFDNAGGPDELRLHLPGGRGQVLVTSRNPQWDALATPLELGVLTRPESVRLLRDRAPLVTPEDADRVADALGDLPQALEQAAAMLAGPPALTADVYLALLEERTADVLARGFPSSTSSGAAASWELAFAALEASEPAALSLLTLLAWLAPEPVPHALLAATADPLPPTLAAALADPLVTQELLGQLVRRGMIHADGSTMLLHRVPAALVRAKTHDERPGDHGATWPNVALALVRAAVPENPRNPDVWPAWQRLLPHVLAVTGSDRVPAAHRHLAWLLDRAATYWQTRGELHAALPLFRRAVQLNRAQLGEDHPTTLASAHNLAIDLRLLGHYTQARILDQEVLTRSRRVLGEDHQDTLGSAHNLALDLSALGHHDQARTLQEDTLARRRRTLGEDHPDTLTSAHNLGIDLRAVGDHEQARVLHEHTLARRRDLLGENHPDTFSSAHNLARDLSALGHHDQARALHEHNLRQRRHTLGERHHQVYGSMTHLAHELHALGDHEQARALHEQALTRRREILGDDHPHTLESARNLAAALDALGLGDEAERRRNWARDQERPT